MSPTPAPVPAPKMGLSKWLTGHKWEAGLGASGIAVTVYLAYRSRKSSSASGSSTTGSSGASTAVPVSAFPFSGGSGESGDMSGLDSLLTQLQTELSGAGQSSSASSSVEGSWSGAAAGSDTVFDPVAAGSSIPSGVQLFWEPVAGSGVFDPYGPGVPAGTPLYVAPNSSQPTGFQQGNAGGGPPTKVPA